MITPVVFAQAVNTSQGSGAGVFFGFGFFFLALALFYICAWLYALYSAATRPDLDTMPRVIWILILLFLPGLGTLLYFLMRGLGR
jgi:hypothetical protein